jgi:hypothetical protein
LELVKRIEHYIATPIEEFTPGTPTVAYMYFSEKNEQDAINAMQEALEVLNI